MEDLFSNWWRPTIPGVCQSYFHNEVGKLTRCCLWAQDARILGRHTLEEPNPTSKNLFLLDTAGKISMLFSGFCVGRVALSKVKTRVYTLQGMKEMYINTKRCGHTRHCGISYLPTYRWSSKTRRRTPWISPSIHTTHYSYHPKCGLWHADVGLLGEPPLPRSNTMAFVGIQLQTHFLNSGQSGVPWQVLAAREFEDPGMSCEISIDEDITAIQVRRYSSYLHNMVYPRQNQTTWRRLWLTAMQRWSSKVEGAQAEE